MIKTFFVKVYVLQNKITFINIFGFIDKEDIKLININSNNSKIIPSCQKY